MVMDVDRPEPGGAPRVVVVELEHVRGRASGKRRAGATLFCGYRSEWPPLASRPACLPVINQTSTLQRGRLAGTRTHADRNGRATRACALRSPRYGTLVRARG